MVVLDSSFEVVPLDASAHAREDFSCGRDQLDRYIRTQARQDAKSGLTRVFVMVPTDQPSRIGGYYTMSACHVRLAELPPDLTARMPRYPDVPALRLGRLALDTHFQGLGLGKRLLRDAFRRVLEVRTNAGVALVVVDAIDEEAVGFYQRYSFRLVQEENTYPRRMIVPVATIEATLE